MCQKCNATKNLFNAGAAEVICTECHDFIHELMGKPGPCAFCEGHNETRVEEWTVPQVETVKHGSVEYQLHDGFPFEGFFVTDPTKSPDGSQDVDPVEFYGCDFLNWRDRAQNARLSKTWTKTAMGNWYS